MSREMVNSGILWIGDIPLNWGVRKVKDAFIRKNEKAFQENPIVLSLTRAGVKIRDISTNEGQLASSYNEYNPVEPFDLLINPMDLYSGANCSVSLVSGVISPAYINLKAKDNASPQYYDYYFKTQYWSMAFFAHGKGISFDNRWTLGVDTLFRYNIPYPTLVEQQKIASFLDRKCTEIDEMIALQEKIIDELKAYKQSVITEAVTKGLNPNVPMKESGIEWIGQIPAHWEKHPFKAYFKTSKGLSITKENLVEEGVPVISYGQIHSKNNTGTSLSNKLFRYVSEEYISTNPECLSNKYDLFFADTSEDREGAGNIAFIDTDTPIFAGYHTIIARPKDDVKTKYIAYLIKTDAWRSLIRSRVQGVKLYSVSQKFINQTSIIIPPIYEQQSIADYLDEKCSNIDSLINIKQQKIEELKDYKKSIIYEYVTGKKEVEDQDL